MSKPSPSAVSQTDWARIDTMRDEDIDLSEIPGVTEEQMARAVLRVGSVPIARGKRGCQTLINEALAQYIHGRDLEDLKRRVIRQELSRLK